MRHRRTIWASLLLAVAVMGLLYYAISLHGRKPRRIVVERDVSDVADVGSAQQAKVGYDHYFDRVNRIEGLVLTGTNTGSLSR